MRVRTSGSGYGTPSDLYVIHKGEVYHCYISELEEKLALYAHLAQSMDDIRLGRVHSADDVFNDLLNDLENLDV